MVAAERLGALWGCTATPFPSQACNQMKGGEVGPDSRVLSSPWKKGELFIWGHKYMHPSQWCSF